MKSQYLCFKLSMPGNNSWNGRWSGDGRFYALVRKFTSAKEKAKAILTLAVKSYGYDFGDGWYARIDVSEVTAQEARAVRVKSVGFAGYEWMVDSILRHGRILNSAQERELLEAAT